jgi:hypothetical protein
MRGGEKSAEPFYTLMGEEAMTGSMVNDAVEKKGLTNK